MMATMDEPMMGHPEPKMILEFWKSFRSTLQFGFESVEAISGTKKS